MGIAIYNNYFIDLPLAHACYKILLDQKLTLEDYAQWQPESARSLQFILDYTEFEKQSLEDLLQRTFTADVERFGVVEEVELFEGGK